MQDILNRVFENLAGRLTGPMALRFVLQPMIASILALRAGLRDAREGSPPYFWSVVTDPKHRRELLRLGWKDVGKVFCLAVVLDVIYQIIVARWVYPFETLLVASGLAIVPYLVLRGAVTRLTRGRMKQPESSSPSARS